MTKTPRRNPRWRDLPQKDKAIEASILLTETNQETYSFTLKLGSTRINKGRTAAKSFVTHIRDTMRHHMERRLGSVPPFWIVVEDLDRDGNGVELHVHGVIATDPSETPALKQALLEVAGRDTNRARALRLQPLYSPMVWVRYCFKNLHKGDPECIGFAMEGGLRRAAGRIHDERRQARIRAAESPDHANSSSLAPPVGARGLRLMKRATRTPPRATTIPRCDGCERRRGTEPGLASCSRRTCPTDSAGTSMH